MTRFSSVRFCVGKFTGTWGTGKCCDMFLSGNQNKTFWLETPELMNEAFSRVKSNSIVSNKAVIGLRNQLLVYILNYFITFLASLLPATVCPELVT